MAELEELDWDILCDLRKNPCGRPAVLVGISRCSCKVARFACVPCVIAFSAYTMPSGWRCSLCGWEWDCTSAAEAFTWKPL